MCVVGPQALDVHDAVEERAISRRGLARVLSASPTSQAPRWRGRGRAHERMIDRRHDRVAKSDAASVANDHVRAERRHPSTHSCDPAGRVAVGGGVLHQRGVQRHSQAAENRYPQSRAFKVVGKVIDRSCASRGAPPRALWGMHTGIRGPRIEGEPKESMASEHRSRRPGATRRTSLCHTR